MLHLDVETQTHQAEVPADSHRTGTELSPQVRVDVCLMDQFEAGAFAVRGERDLEPRHHLAELPRHGERLRLLAAFDDATGVPLDLVAAAGLKISADRQKLPRDSVGVGQSVPEISLVGGVSTTSDGDLRRRPVAGAAADLAGHQTSRGDGIDGSRQPARASIDGDDHVNAQVGHVR